MSDVLYPDPQTLIPHRGRFLLIDEIVRLEAGIVEATGFFSIERVEGHFPNMPVVPGVLLLEGLAQTMACGHMTWDDSSTDGTPFLAGFDKVRFKAPVLPPARVHYSITLKEQRFGLTYATGRVSHEGKTVCKARLSGVIVPAGLVE